MTLWKRHVDNSSPPPHPGWVNQLDRLLQLVLLASIATAIAGGALTSNAFNSQSGMETVINLRHASYILSLGKLQNFALPGTLFCTPSNREKRKEERIEEYSSITMPII